MLKKFSLIIVLFSFVLVSFGQTEKEINFVTIEQIAKSLEGKKPMNVGFDIDDTVLFSSPGFYYGKQKYSPENNAFLGMIEFWSEINNGLDAYSIPKESARQVIEIHKKRGDSIYFITARPKTETETVTELLAKTFGIENPNKAIFTDHKKGENTKIKPLTDNKIEIYYGDSDSDIEAAIVAKARPIRIMRAGNSTNKPMPQNGKFGEEVLVNSEF